MAGGRILRSIGQKALNLGVRGLSKSGLHSAATRLGRSKAAATLGMKLMGKQGGKYLALTTAERKLAGSAAAAGAGFSLSGAKASLRKLGSKQGISNITTRGRGMLRGAGNWVSNHKLLTAGIGVGTVGAAYAFSGSQQHAPQSSAYMQQYRGLQQDPRMAAYFAQQQQTQGSWQQFQHPYVQGQTLPQTYDPRMMGFDPNMERQLRAYIAVAQQQLAAQGYR